MTLILPTTQLPLIDVFAVEDDSAQVTWRRLPDGHLTALVENNEQDLGASGRPGAAELRGLQPGVTQSVDLLVDGLVTAQTSICTLPATSASSIKIATISDLHFGETGFGLIKQLSDHGAGSDPYPLRCARSAARDAVEWGAELLIIKGDITCDSRPEEWEMFDDFLADVSIPIMAIPGNHDVVNQLGSRDCTEELQRRSLFPQPVTQRDIGGIRIVAVDSTVPGRSWGNIGRWHNEIREAVDTDQPAMVFTHHHLEERPIPCFWPLGVRYLDGIRIVDSLLEANPDLFLSSGHTHRNRMRRRRSAVITEVSSTKDYPGVWAGYVLSTTGVRQVVRRVSDPDSIRWTDHTHAAVGGVWGRWSPGPLDQRSFAHEWTRSYKVSPTRVQSQTPPEVWPI
ncbi:MAG: metallophosphoesterase [Acidimicrobiales bacterium]|nr:metallophosphoesterase [Acidimicrobiales bacterium]MDG2217094.1 metallophosphoesterase [Acidimicrobiales bacterium]